MASKSFAFRFAHMTSSKDAYCNAHAICLTVPVNYSKSIVTIEPEVIELKMFGCESKIEE